MSQAAVSQGVPPASCYRKDAGSIPLLCMSKCPMGKILNPKLLLMCWSAPSMAATTMSACVYELAYVLSDKRSC